jgi:hypothetical protein
MYYFKTSAQTLRVGALSQLDWRRFRKEFHEASQEAHATENTYAILALALNETLSDEISGEAESSIARLEAQRELLPRQRFTVLHILHLSAVMYAACATGRHAWGFEACELYWQAFLRSPLRRTPVLRSMAHTAHARLLLNECTRAGASTAVLREVQADIKAATIATIGQDSRLCARVAYLQGDHPRALSLFARSAEVFAGRGGEPEALRDRYAVGRLTGGDQGEQMAQAALDTLEQKFDCHDARRDLKVYIPELAGSIEHG